MHPPTGVRVTKGWTTDATQSLDAMETGAESPALKMAAMLVVYSNPDYSVQHVNHLTYVCQKHFCCWKKTFAGFCTAEIILMSQPVSSANQSVG